MSHPPAAGFDARRIITPESFSVAPHLLGLPLASPSRRLVAILVDLLLVACVANLGGKILFALALGVSFFWFAGRKLDRGGTGFSRAARIALRSFGALMLFVVALQLWHRAQRSVEQVVNDDDPGDSVALAGVGASSRRSAVATARMVGDLVAVQNARDSAHAFPAARDAVRQMRRSGMGDEQIREALGDAASGSDKPYVAAALRAALPAVSAEAAARDSADAHHPDSLAARYVAALGAGDSAGAAALRPRLTAALAHDSLSSLQGKVRQLQEERRGLRREAEEAKKKRGLLATLLGLFDDLGIGFGWTGLYFTACTALMKGQTPGKKLTGIRVLRLDGLPMTLWASFERFGGYAAGLFTGLTGYMQVYWDRNRQAIQDKISETVVIRHHRGVQLPVAPVAHRPVMSVRPPPPSGAAGTWPPYQP